MILKVVNLFIMYILLAMVLSVLVKIFPKFIRDTFMIFNSFRAATTRLTLSVYKTKTNFEVNLLAVFIIPFMGLLGLYMMIQGFIFSYPQYIAINTMFYIAIFFLVAAILPNDEELTLFKSKQSNHSLLIFFAKIVLLFQIYLSTPHSSILDLITISVVIIPISPYFGFFRGNSRKDYFPMKSLY